MIAPGVSVRLTLPPCNGRSIEYLSQALGSPKQLLELILVDCPLVSVVTDCFTST